MIYIILMFAFESGHQQKNRELKKIFDSKRNEEISLCSLLKRILRVDMITLCKCVGES